MKRVLILIFLSTSLTMFGSQLPTGFVESLIAQNLDPTDMVLTPDGRMLITIKSGKIVIVEDGVLRNAPLLNIESVVDNYNERGLGHIVLDPHFEDNGYYYLYYTVEGMNINRVSRFTAIGNTSSADSESIIFEMDNLAGTIHNAGDMVFGLDEKLYISTGDGADASTSQSLTSVLGKILRINSDGTIPIDNPFFGNTAGKFRAIYALGFRNPFSMTIQPGTGKIFVCDVGGGAWEEIDHIEAGKNYGWPGIEGRRTTQAQPANYKDPLYAYPHGGGLAAGCSILGAAFYNPITNQFPETYIGKFFFADYCNGYISYADTQTGVVNVFATGVNRPLAIITADDGSMYYLARAGLGGGSEQDNTSTSNGTLWKITYTGSGSPSVSVPPQNTVTAIGETAAFKIVVQGSQPLAYQWQENEVDLPGATGSSLEIANTELSDDGNKYRCIVTNSFGSITSSEAVLTVTANSRPEPEIQITLSSGEETYRAGETITYSGTAIDAEDGALPLTSLTWKIDFHHDAHYHPASASASGEAGGSYIIPLVGETSDNVWYRISLTAVDLGNPSLSKTVYKDVFPKKSTITLKTVPPGLTLILDGQPVTTPHVFTSVVNTLRSLEAPPGKLGQDAINVFESWNGFDQDNPIVEFNTPEENKTITANYTVKPLGNGVGLVGSYFTNQVRTLVGKPTVVRIDPLINFDWGEGSPAPSISANTFTARWEGELFPIFTDEYTFHVVADDGVRLWINDKILINKWIDQGPTEWTGTVTLEEAKRYPIRLEFYENGGGAVIKLLWSSSKFEKTIIPTRQLEGIITSIEPITRGKVSVYPTMATSTIKILKEESTSYEWTILNSLGQMIKLGSASNETIIDINDLNRGIYILRINDTKEVFRFIKH